MCIRLKKYNTSVANCSACSSEACSAGVCRPGYSNFSAGNPPSCVANVCFCPNGTPTVATGAGGTLCEAHGAVDCSNCTSVGYWLNATAGSGQQSCSGTFMCLIIVVYDITCCLNLESKCVVFLLCCSHGLSHGVQRNCTRMQHINL